MQIYSKLINNNRNSNRINNNKKKFSQIKLKNNSKTRLQINNNCQNNNNNNFQMTINCLKIKIINNILNLIRQKYKSLNTQKL